MRLVLDTNLIPTAVLSDAGASRQLLRSALQKRFVLLCSVPLMIEYESMLKRPHHRKKADITAEDADAHLDALAAIVEPVRLSFHWRPLLRGPQWEMLLATAVNGQIRAMAPGPAWKWIRSLE